MMQTVEAEINVDGTVTLLEPLPVKVKTKALVMVLENGGSSGGGNARQMLEFLQNNRLPAEVRPSVEKSVHKLFNLYFTKAKFFLTAFCSLKISNNVSRIRS